ncbi:Phox domain-containing, partial [Globisporangium polare]
MGLDAMEPTGTTSATWLWDARSTTSSASTKHVAPYPGSANNSSSNSNTNSCHTSENANATSSATTTASRLRRKSSASRLRKSMSDKPLDNNNTDFQSDHHQHYQYHNSASLRSVADENQQLESDMDPELFERRQRIMARAEEILRGKRHVGMQFGETCPVCLADDVDTQLTQCGHRIHARCIKRWMQSGTRCPVCREQVTGVEEAFTPPSHSQFGELTKDHSYNYRQGDDSASTSHDEDQNSASGGFEWGWFEDFDEFDEQNDDSVHFGANGGLLLPTTMSQRRASMPSFPSSTRSSAALMNRELSGAFEICRTFPPLRPVYDSPYACSPHVWMRALPSHRHIAAKIQIRSFRIVEAKHSQAQHAEYLVELQLDGRYFSRWRRFSALSRFVSTVGSSEFRETHATWSKLEAASRWFNRLELAYLHERCKL